jgi:pyruvate formate lyase activating enzyme
MVTGFNDDEAERKRMVEYLVSINHEGLAVEILRLHHLGKCKYEALGLRYMMEGVNEPDMTIAQNFENELKSHGLCARIG